MRTTRILCTLLAKGFRNIKSCFHFMELQCFSYFVNILALRHDFLNTGLYGFTILPERVV